MRFPEIPLRENVAGGRKIRVKCTPGRAADRHKTFLRSFSEHTQQLSLADDRVELQITEFAHTDSTAVENLQDRPISHLPRFFALDFIDHFGDFLFGKRLGQNQLSLRRIEQFRGIPTDDMTLLQILKPRTNRRRPSGARRRATTALSFPFEKLDDMVSRNRVRNRYLSASEVLRKKSQITSVRLARIRREAPLEHQSGKKNLDFRVDQGTLR